MNISILTFYQLKFQLLNYSIIPSKFNNDSKDKTKYSGRGKFMPLSLKSKILETPGFLVTDYIKMFPLWIRMLNLQASLMVQCKLSTICNYSATCPQSKQTLCAHFLEEKRRFYNLWVNKKKFQLKRNVIQWVEVSME